MALRLAVVVSQAPGLGGTPSAGHRSTAVAKASAAASSAMSRSPKRLVMVATTRAHSSWCAWVIACRTSTLFTGTAAPRPSGCNRHRLPDVFKTFWYADCASVGCILRVPGRPVDLERYALRECSRFDQVKRHVRAVFGEQPRALADDHGADEQVDLVDEVVLEQPPGQGAAAVHLQLTPRLGLQLADGRR